MEGMLDLVTILGYGLNNFMIDADTGRGYKINNGYQGEWPLAFYLLERNKYFSNWRVINIVLHNN